ncbi:hypothetical protein FQR65_LT16646 [Abscondita terminalis]|nr:hypothetical protein FQR65_LT16646 [Abscondita terminalis]
MANSACHSVQHPDRQKDRKGFVAGKPANVLDQSLRAVRLIKNAVLQVDIPLEEALRMATLYRGESHRTYRLGRMRSRGDSQYNCVDDAFGITAGPICTVVTPQIEKPQTKAKEKEEELKVDLPQVPREFRAAWVASVANINWPSKNNLSTEEQKQEAISLLDFLKSNRFNAVIFQVRPAADALYKSEYEPWSVFLTGQQGKAPYPYYDPLEFWVEEAHKRGLELHVWLNALSCTSQRKRYGVHFDDYFYPYAEYNGGQDFPDTESWNAYVKSGGKLTRADWRRNSVNTFIERIYKEIKAEKNHVKFGISPFGIWKPGYPAGIQGSSQYDQLYADAKLWLNKGWIDYFAPQLYWPIEPAKQSFTTLLRWWESENTLGRHVWPERLLTDPYRTEALAPRTPGLTSFYLSAPFVSGDTHKQSVFVKWFASAKRADPKKSSKQWASIRVSVSMSGSEEVLEEVVVTAMGVKQEVKSLGFALQSVFAKQITESNQTNVVLHSKARMNWSSTLPKEENRFLYPSCSTVLILTDLIKELNNEQSVGIFQYAKIRAAWAHVSITSCTKYFDVNEDPNNPSRVEAASRVAGAITTSSGAAQWRGTREIAAVMQYTGLQTINSGGYAASNWRFTSVLFMCRNEAEAKLRSGDAAPGALGCIEEGDRSQDAVMQIFEELIDKLRIHQVDNFKSWLYTFSRNYCLMQLRKDKRVQQVDIEDHLAESEHLLDNSSDQLWDEVHFEKETCIVNP